MQPHHPRSGRYLPDVTVVSQQLPGEWLTKDRFPRTCTTTFCLEMAFQLWDNHTAKSSDVLPVPNVNFQGNHSSSTDRQSGFPAVVGTDSSNRGTTGAKTEAQATSYFPAQTLLPLSAASSALFAEVGTPAQDRCPAAQLFVPLLNNKRLEIATAHWACFLSKAFCDNAVKQCRAPHLVPD
jgi:hypothetical protein